MRRRIVLVVVLTAVALVGSGTFGASTAAVDRPVSLSVVDDRDAFVGVAASDGALAVDEARTAFRIRNRFDDEIRVSAVAIDHPAISVQRVVDGDRVVFDGRAGGDPLGPGRDAAVAATCSRPMAPGPVEVVVRGSGPASFDVRTTVSVKCAEPSSTTPVASGTEEHDTGPGTGGSPEKTLSAI